MHKDIVVCAANVYTCTGNGGVPVDLVFPDTCHMGRNMMAIVKFMRDNGIEVKLNNTLNDRGQGFIDQSGLYYDRSEAYTLAKESGQPFNNEYTLPKNKLDSSCIRHFKEDTKWEEYL